MKILFISPIYLPKQDGTVRLIENLANGLVFKNHSVTILTRSMRGAPPRETTEKVDVLRVPPQGSSFLDRLRFIVNASLLTRNVLRQTKFNVVHVFGSSALMAALLASFRGVPIIVTFPGVAEEVLVGGDPNRAFKFVGLSALQLMNLAARHITVPTTNSARSILQNIGRLNKRKLAIIPNPLELKVFLSEPSMKASESNLSTERKEFYPEILSVGTLSYRKGFDILIKAFNEVLFHLKNARLTIVGRGPRFKELTELAKKLEMKNHVRFLSGLSDSSLANLYKSSDIFVSASRSGGEAFGYAVVEAMAAGKPVISTSTPGPKEIIEKSGGGLLVEADDVKSLSEAIMRLCANSQVSQKMGESAWRFVRENFDSAAIVSKFERLYVS